MQCNAQIESSKLFRSIRIGKGMRYALGCLVFLSSSVFVFSQQISVIAQVSSRQVYVGEAFILQITVSGSDQVNLDNFAQIGEFKSSLSSSGPSNSRSITIINGKINRFIKFFTSILPRSWSLKMSKYVIQKGMSNKQW